jgi:Rhodopirellula transposase DDE domain
MKANNADDRASRPRRGTRLSASTLTKRIERTYRALVKKGHKVCPTVVGNLLRDMGYSLQANGKTREGRHIDRDVQFQYINTQAKAFLATNDPVISVDTKKKELVGDFKEGV